MDIAVVLSQPDERDIQLICACAEEMVLDNEELMPGDFVVAKYKGRIAGFGRLKKHSDCMELCTLGVVQELRRRGIGRKIIGDLISRASSELYVVCIIPAYFRKFGFEITADYPVSIRKKHRRCTEKYVVEESYYAMKLTKDKC